MQNAKLNILVVGAGMYVSGRGTDGVGTVLPALVQASKKGSVDQIYVAATSPESIKQLQEKLTQTNQLLGADNNVTGYPTDSPDNESYKQAIQEGHQIDCAIVSVPDHLHYKVTNDLMNAGIHVMVVKPLAPTVQEVKDLIHTAKQNNVYGVVEFHKRFDKANLRFKSIIESQQIGDPLYFHVEFSQKKLIPQTVFQKWVQNSNIFQYLGIHYADMIHFLTGAKPKRVLALGQKNLLASQDIDTYDAIEAIIEWEAPSKKTFVSTILTNWVDPNSKSAMSDQQIKVIGTKGRFTSDQKNRGNELITDDAGIESINPYFSAFYPDISGEHQIFDGYGPESIWQFLEDVKAVKTGAAVDSKSGLRATFEDALVSTMILEAVNSSLEGNGEWVDI